jgi:DNA-nicking Smr family endonuclease
VAKKPKGFNNALAGLKDVKLPAPPKPAPAPWRNAPPGAPSSDRAPAPPSDDRLFEDEMSGVAPLAPDPRGRLGAPPATEARAPIRRRLSEDAEAYAALADLVDGSGPFDISDSDEYIEGLAPGVDRRLLKKLRKGEYAVQAHIDLHGLSADQARLEVERFLDGARAAGRRCVLIVHGRGLNSKEGIPVLKERLKIWLTRGPLARGVLAFATARPSDGGAGAVYVLLRR